MKPWKRNALAALLSPIWLPLLIISAIGFVAGLALVAYRVGFNCMLDFVDWVTGADRGSS